MTPTPSPVPSPTPDPDEYRGAIAKIVEAGRNNNPTFFSAYTQAQSEEEKRAGVPRQDCSSQIYSFYSVLRGKDAVSNPFIGADHATCRGLFDKFKNASRIPDGWKVYSELKGLHTAGQPAIPENWKETADMGDIALFRKENTKDWHVVLCLGDEMVIDRGQWAENSPTGEMERGIFVRSFDQLPSKYDIVMIIDPGEDSLSMKELLDYLENPPDVKELLK